MASIPHAANPVDASLPTLVPTAPMLEPLAEPAEQRFLIRGIDWDTYCTISDALVGRHYYMSYDGEDLELMTISDDHAQYRGLLSGFVVILTEETGQPRRTSGDMTMRRKDLKRGIEADESYYIVNEPQVRFKKIDLRKDPPPDLGIEIDLTTDSRRRLGIYGKIRVPEIWRHDGQVVTILQLQVDGKYLLVERSLYFPFLAAADLTRFLAMRDQVDEANLLLSFRKWAREQVAKGQG